MSRLARGGQTSVETLLLISVLVVALVSAGYLLADQFQDGMQQMADGAENAYVDPARAP